MHYQRVFTMQIHINGLVEHANHSKMLISESKTKAAIFNTLHSVDIQPNITLGNIEQPIEVVDEIKLLGQIITTDMKTIKNTRNMCRNAYARMNTLRRLSALGCPRNELLDVLRMQVLCMVEQAVPYWAPMITKAESDMIERVLKTGLHIILHEKYLSIDSAQNILMS